MELRDYIIKGSEKAGSLTALGKMLDLTQPQISTIKAHKKPLPDKALVTLAEYLSVPERDLIAANNIAMGKHVEFWRPFATHAKAASIALAVMTVTFFVTPTTAEARPYSEAEQFNLYYVNYYPLLFYLATNIRNAAQDSYSEQMKTSPIFTRFDILESCAASQQPALQ
jgi:hypothetical protein